jgi:hypothetical protein
MALDTTIGGTAADSYGTLAEYTAYATGQGWTLAGTDGANEVHLRRAAVYLDRKHKFIGMQQYQFQALAWPRLVRDLVNDWPIDPDTIPTDIKHAQFEVAYLLQGGLDPFATIETSTTKDMIKVGPITLDEETTPTGTPRLVAVEGLLRPYLKAGAGQVALVRG